jgi:hypothetical protein
VWKVSDDVRVKLSKGVTEASCRRASKSSHRTALELRRVVEERYVYMHYIYDSCYYSDAPSFERCTCNSVASNGSGEAKPSRSICWKAIFTGFQLAEGLEKLSRGRKKFLASGWTFKMAYSVCPAHSRLDVGLDFNDGILSGWFLLCQAILADARGNPSPETTYLPSYLPSYYLPR